VPRSGRSALRRPTLRVRHEVFVVVPQPVFGVSDSQARLSSVLVQECGEGGEHRSIESCVICLQKPSPAANVVDGRRTRPAALLARPGRRSVQSHGGPSGNRTLDLRIKSPTLAQFPQHPPTRKAFTTQPLTRRLALAGCWPQWWRIGPKCPTAVPRRASQRAD
jgi:hypothetical protein